LSPSDCREEAAEKQKQFQTHQSDHLTVCNAYDQWFAIKSTSEKWNFCDQNFLGMNTLKSMYDLKKQFLEMLVELGYVEKINLENYNVNGKNEKIVKSVILAGLYPNTAGIQMPKQLYEETGEGAVAVNIKSNQIRFFAKDLRVFIHPSSLLFTEEKYEHTAVMVYGSQVATSKVFIRDCSTAPGIAMLLLGGKVKVMHGGKAIEINGVRFKTFERVSALVGGMRSLLDKTLELKVKEPGLDVIENEMGKLCIDLLQFAT
jgi:ATP-dependent RNA helicase DHX57